MRAEVESLIAEISSAHLMPSSAAIVAKPNPMDSSEMKVTFPLVSERTNSEAEPDGVSED